MIAVFQKPDFSDNSKKYKTKTIPENSILLKPKYGFKNREAALRNSFRFVLLFVQCIQLESRLVGNLLKFPNLTFSFQFSYRFFIFRCIIFDFFLQLLCSFKLQLLFHIKICLLVRRKRFCVYFTYTASRLAHFEPTVV